MFACLTPLESKAFIPALLDSELNIIYWDLSLEWRVFCSFLAFNFRSLKNLINQVLIQWTAGLIQQWIYCIMVAVSHMHSFMPTDIMVLMWVDHPWLLNSSILSLSPKDLVLNKSTDIYWMLELSHWLHR